VNELDHERAIETLRGWVVVNHPLYAGMVDDSLGKGGGEEEEDCIYGSASVEEEETADGTQRRRRRMRAQITVEMRDVERLLLRALEYDRTADAAADVYEALGYGAAVCRQRLSTRD